MSDKDTITKDYMQDKEIFADAFNFLLYGGRQVIKPEQLRPLDTTSIVLPYGDDSKPIPVQKYRDILKEKTHPTDQRRHIIPQRFKKDSRFSQCGHEIKPAL